MENDQLSNRRSLKLGSLVSSVSTEYVLNRRLGEGSFGVVWKAGVLTGEMRGSSVALKLINYNKSEESKILREMQVGLNAHSVAKNWTPEIYEVFVFNNVLVIAMEFIDGFTLQQLVKWRPLGEIPVAYIIREVLSALTAFRKNKLVHRDIKGANVMISKSGRVYLCDFGVSRIFDFSVARTFVGTVLFMAPEMAKTFLQQQHDIPGCGYNHKVDVWALGITTLEALYGEPPRAQSSATTDVFLSNVLRSSAPSLDRTRFSIDCRKFVNCCLEHNPDKRIDPENLLNHSFLNFSDISARKAEIVKYVLLYQQSTNH